MDCSEYLEHASEFLDGRAEESLAGRIDGHLSRCPRCRRHNTILEEGLRLLQTLPEIDIPSDFQPRLDHRIFHLEDGSSLAREHLGSGVTAVSVLTMAVLMAFAAWTPRMSGSDRTALELPAVVVNERPERSFTPRARPPTFSRGLSLFTTADFQEGVWGDTHQLLFEYSSLSARRRGPGLTRTGLQ